jgi:hypothetical protein
MISHPVTVTAPTTEPSKMIKRTLFRITLIISMIGSVIVSTILFLQGGLALGHLRYFIDIGQHPLHITSTLLLVFGLLSILTFIILTIGLIKVNRNFAIIAAVLLSICSFGLIILSIWSFVTLASGQLPKSINATLVKELDQTQFNIAAGNIIVDNTIKMARLEKQHQCCGISDPIDDYRNRQLSAIGSSSSSLNTGSSRGRTTQSQRNPSILLPISCCNEKYRSDENNLCMDIYGNNTNPLNRYNTEGCYVVIVREKFKRIQQQGVTTIVAACLGVISSIALAAVIKLLAEGYQVVPLRTTT